MRLRLIVELDAEEITARLSARPELAEGSIYELRRRPGGLELRRRSWRRRYESPDLLLQHLRVALRPGRRPDTTEVRARFVHRPNPATFAAVTVETLAFGGLNLLAGLTGIGARLQVRRAERLEMINLVATTLSPYAVAERGVGPYRTR